MSGSIGGQTFLHLLGEVGQPTNQIETFARRGIDGEIFRDLGVRIPPFQLVSNGLYATYEDAVDAFHVFDALKTDVPQTLVKDGVDFSALTSPATPFDVRVVDVQQLELDKKLDTTEGTNTFWLSCRWTLKPVPVTP